METEDLCFRHSIYSLKLRRAGSWQAKVLLGILWFSLGRYYFFLTASSWGSWHDKIALDEVLRFPVRMPTAADLRDHIVHIVDELRFKEVEDDNLFTSGHTGNEVRELEADLDTAVFDLYGLAEDERDQITDMCTYGLDLFYRHFEGNAVKRIDQQHLPNTSGNLVDLLARQDGQGDITGYLRTFLQIWNRELEPDGEFHWEVIGAEHGTPMLAVIFTTQAKGERSPVRRTADRNQWESVLRCLDDSLGTPVDSRMIYIDGFVRLVSDTEIMIIKRNERRSGRKTAVREDAEATLLQAVHLQQAKEGS